MRIWLTAMQRLRYTILPNDMEVTVECKEDKSSDFGDSTLAILYTCNIDLYDCKNVHMLI